MNGIDMNTKTPQKISMHIYERNTQTMLKKFLRNTISIPPRKTYTT